jgi:hypothetical protein
LKSKMFLLWAAAALVTAPYSTAIALGQQADYDVINLGTPLGGSFAISAGISAAGFLGGYANLPDNVTQARSSLVPLGNQGLGHARRIEQRPAEPVLRFL